MLNRTFLKQLQRRDDEEALEKEAFDAYLARVQPLLPTFPSEVIRDWVYRHCEALYDYAWLDFHRFNFRNEMWSTERVVAEVQTWNEATVKGWERLIYDGHPRALESFMLEKGTWPVPITVIEEPKSIPRRQARRLFREPYQLLEGHHRLAYLRALARDNRTASTHRIWIARWGYTSV